MAKSLTMQGQIEHAARMVARFQNRRRRLRKELREVDANLRMARRELRTLTALAAPAPDAMPNRLFGERQTS